MVEKIKLTKAQADAIYQVRNMHFYKSDEELIRSHAENPINWTDILEPLNSLQLLDLIDALRVGYEVDHSLEWEKINKGDVLVRSHTFHELAIYEGEIDDKLISVKNSKGKLMWKKREAELYAKKVGELNA